MTNIKDLHTCSSRSSYSKKMLLNIRNKQFETSELYNKSEFEEDKSHNLKNYVYLFDNRSNVLARVYLDNR